jgi:hypothetical protein
MPSELEKLAPEGQIWLCGACGRRNKNKYEVGDESCYMNAVLVYEKSIMEEDGVLITAEAVEDPVAEIGS